MEIACALFEEVPSTTSPSESPQSVASDQASAWWFRTPMVGMLLRVFSASWGLPEPQIGLLGGMKEQCADGGAPPSPSASASAPFVFMADPEAVEKARRNQRLAALLIDQSGGPLAASPHSQTVLQDHQMREHTLDALILLLRNPLGLESLVPCSPSPIGAPGIKGGVLVGVFRLLQGLVLALLQREAPAHVRAALALLGAIHWRPSSPLPMEAEVPSPQTPPGGAHDYADDLAALAHLLGILCDVFDCGWEAERLPLESLVPRSGGGSDKAAVAGQAHHLVAPTASGGIPPAGPVFMAPQMPLLPPAPHAPSSPPLVWAGPAPPPKPLLQVEVGLGHRVLVQVLQAWKRLCESGGPGTALALGRTHWWPRVAMARMHEKR